MKNTNIVDIKAFIIEHSGTSRELSKTINQAEKNTQVGSNSFLYSNTKKSEDILNKKNVKITKRAHNFTGFTSSQMLKF